jgi:TRAP-type C4-dicarboxylate transport system substrate-binding protein
MSKLWAIFPDATLFDLRPGVHSAILRAMRELQEQVDDGAAGEDELLLMEALEQINVKIMDTGNLMEDVRAWRDSMKGEG